MILDSYLWEHVYGVIGLIALFLAIYKGEERRIKAVLDVFDPPTKGYLLAINRGKIPGKLEYQDGINRGQCWGFGTNEKFLLRAGFISKNEHDHINITFKGKAAAYYIVKENHFQLKMMDEEKLDPTWIPWDNIKYDEQ